MMNPALIGAAAGALFGFANFILLWSIAGRMERKTDPNRHSTARLLKAAAWFDLVLFTIVGYVIGPMLLG